MHKMEYAGKPEGASPGELASLESSICATLPSAYKNLLSESDGPILYFGFKELQFLSCREIIGEDIYNLMKYMPGCFPMCLDGNGNICVGKIENGFVSGIYVAATNNLGWDDAKYISPTFQGFIDDTLSPEQRLYE